MTRLFYTNQAALFQRNMDNSWPLLALFLSFQQLTESNYLPNKSLPMTGFEPQIFCHPPHVITFNQTHLMLKPDT